MPDLPRRRLLLAGALAAAPLRAGAVVRTLRPDLLRVGTYFVNPPFEFVSGHCKVGFEVDLMDRIAGHLTLRPVFVATQWERILSQLQNNEFDCIVGGITITSARRETLAWSVPYMTTTLSLIVDSRRSPSVASLADLKGATVGVQEATTDYDAAEAMRRAGRIAAVRTYPFALIGQAMTDLAAGRITAVMKVYPVAAWLVRQTPGLRIVAQVPDDPQPLGIGFNPGNPGLLSAVNDALQVMQRDASLEAIGRRWGVQVTAG